MAVTVTPAVLLSIFLLTIIITISTTAGEHHPTLYCLPGNGGGDVATAVAIKQRLVEDLMVQVPGRKEQNYCNAVLWNGVQMYGHGQCITSGGGDAGPACYICLSRVGRYLIDGCKVTGVGKVQGPVCYIDVGFSNYCL